MKKLTERLIEFAGRKVIDILRHVRSIIIRGLSKVHPKIHIEVP